MQTDDEEEAKAMSFRDPSTQVNDWQSCSNDELNDEIAFRLSNYHFAMSSRRAMPLVRCFERKDASKA
jgi:hypothetical protein